MKKYSKIFIFIFALFALCGCEQKTIIQGGDGDDEDVVFPSGNYIFFNVENPTRAALKEDYLREDFSVLGYRYVGKDGWKAAKAMASQNRRTGTFRDFKGNEISNGVSMGVFGLSDRYNTAVTKDTIPDKQRVEYRDEVHQYEPLQEWEPNLTYSFFAWYPDSLKVNGEENSNVNYRTVEGNPYITYTLDVANREKMIDVMTACKIDAKKRDGINVGLTMEHRLSVLDIQAVNVISAKDIKGVWGEEGIDTTNISDNAEVFVNITSLSLTLDKLYTKAQISLNTDEETCDYVKVGAQNVKNTIIPSEPTTGNVSFNFTDDATASDPQSDWRVEYYSSADYVEQLVHKDKKLILIPQDEPIHATFNIKYTVECGGVSKEYEIPKKDNTINETIKAEATVEALEEGCYHYFELTFSKNGLFIKAQKYAEWEDFTVKHDFE